MSANDSQDSGSEPRNDRFEDEVCNIDIGTKMPDFENIECEPSEHEGDRAAVVVFGANDNDVRQITMCTKCQMVTQEKDFDDVQGLVLESAGTVRNRLKNYPGEEELVKVPKEEVLDEKAEEVGYDDYEVTHAGHNDEELLFSLTSAEGGDDDE